MTTSSRPSRSTSSTQCRAGSIAVEARNGNQRAELSPAESALHDDGAGELRQQRLTDGVEQTVAVHVHEPAADVAGREARTGRRVDEDARTGVQPKPTLRLSTEPSDRHEDHDVLIAVEIDVAGLDLDLRAGDERSRLRRSN